MVSLASNQTVEPSTYHHFLAESINSKKKTKHDKNIASNEGDSGLTLFYMTLKERKMPIFSAT
jgi:hypothetical protein